MRTASLFIAFLLSLSAFAAQHDATPSVAATEKQKQFIQKLFSEKRHFECIAETRRYLFLNQYLDADSKHKLVFFMAANYFLGAQYTSAVKIISEELPPDYTHGRILLSQALKKTGRLEESFHALETLVYPSDDPFLRYELLLRKTESLIALGKYDDAAREIASQKAFFSSSHSLLDISAALSSLNGKPPLDAQRAALYSAICPGAGHVYAGTYIDGILSFAAVLLTAFAAQHYYRNDEQGLGGLFAFFSAVLYAGNIYGAYNAASAANRAFFQKTYSESIAPLIPAYEPLRFMEMPESAP